VVWTEKTIAAALYNLPCLDSAVPGEAFAAEGQIIEPVGQDHLMACMVGLVIL